MELGLADHATPVVSLVTEAVNCVVWPVATAVDVGLTATLTADGATCVGAGVTWPHPAPKIIRERTAQQRKSFRFNRRAPSQKNLWQSKCQKSYNMRTSSNTVLILERCVSV